MDIPEYYRKFQTSKPEKTAEENKVEKPIQDENVPKTQSKQWSKTVPQPSQVKDKTRVFQGNGFTLNQLEDWEDKTIYTLMGPVTDGIQHNVIISVDKEPALNDLTDYAELHIKTLAKELKSCMLLKKNKTKLTNGTDAYEAVFSWYPTDQVKIYQHQIFFFIDNIAYKITASFTKKTIKTLGPAVERMMLSFNSAKP